MIYHIKVEDFLIFLNFNYLFVFNFILINDNYNIILILNNGEKSGLIDYIFNHKSFLLNIDLNFEYT